MQIQLCEDDGLFHEGVPQIVILVVKFDDGKTKRIPYPADKTISALYQDLQAIAPKVAEAPQAILELKPLEEDTKPQSVAVSASMGPSDANKGHPKSAPDKSNVIEKEDIVTMVKMQERDKGATNLLRVGADYRVMQVYGPRITLPGDNFITVIPDGYDVVDDTAPAGIERLHVYPDEVVLKSKRLSKVIEKVMAVEEILKCPSCQVDNVLVLEGTEFKGTCEGCGQPIVIARVIAKCGTAKCGQEVSCFDVGGKYAGTCGKCHANLEVPYNA